ncbi:MAG: hypothetical protein ACXACA_08805 [Candidatus Ranarchaeia archaeon]
MAEIVDIVRREIGRDPKVLGYAVFSSKGEIAHIARIDENYLKDIIKTANTMGKYMTYGFFHTGDERLMILKTQDAFVTVVFTGDVRIGYLMLLASRLRATFVQSAAGLETSDTPAKPPTVTAQPKPPTISKEPPPAPVQPVADLKVKESPEAPAAPIQTEAPTGSTEPLSGLPPPPVKVATLSSKDVAPPVGTSAISAPPSSARIKDLTKATPSVTVPTPTTPVETKAPTKTKPAAKAKPKPAVKEEVIPDFDTGMERVPIPSEQFADLWDDFPTSPLNTKFGEISLDVLSQVDGISNLTTITERLPHLSSVQVYQVVVEAFQLGYISFS